MKQDSVFKCRFCLSQETDTAEECPHIEVNGQSLDAEEK